MVVHVIRNLLDNAVRFGGRAGPIEVVVQVSAAEVTVRVIDRGEPPDPGASRSGCRRAEFGFALARSVGPSPGHIA